MDHLKNTIISRDYKISLTEFGVEVPYRLNDEIKIIYLKKIGGKNVNISMESSHEMIILFRFYSSTIEKIYQILAQSHWTIFASCLLLLFSK